MRSLKYVMNIQYPPSGRCCRKPWELSIKESTLGTFGKIGVLSFNGNKTITTGGGGMLLTNDEELGNHLKHITTQAKIPHPWEYDHDYVGYNYRMPNIKRGDRGCSDGKN